MKKIKLSIKEPCHENWDEMSQADKGRFCSSCCKQVIDFTSMSDRQLAEFFKKPNTGVCGRFHNDQLERSLNIPQKRIPWLRYFFQFTWPALVLTLKSCGLKNSTLGAPAIFSAETKKQTTETRGLQSESIMMGDTIAVMDLDTGFVTKDTRHVTEEITKGDVVGVIIPDITQPNTEVAVKDSEPHKSLMKDSLKEDSYDTYTICNSYTMGFVMPGQTIEIKDKDSGITLKQKQSPLNENKSGILAFPNPIHAGGLLTISLKHKEDIPSNVQLYDASARLVLNVSEDLPEESTVFNIRIPTGLKTGIYFLRLIDREGNVVTKKIMVE